MVPGLLCKRIIETENIYSEEYSIQNISEEQSTHEYSGVIPQKLKHFCCCGRRSGQSRKAN